MLSATSTDYAPWYVVPADRKWFTRLTIARIVRETLEQLNPQFPVISKEQKAQLAEAKRHLEQETD